ncbi:MAG: hypothetical protein M3350_02410 [Actinomycetota bacterium]|nr:hypothetical protein [Actinomycetota bacterium]
MSEAVVRHRRRLVCALVAVPLSAALLVPAAGESAKAESAASKQTVRILSPGEDRLVRSRLVRLVVRAPSRVRRISARLGSRSISRSFKRGRGGLWVARRRLSPGLTFLHVSARVGRRRVVSDNVEFVVGRRSARFLRVGRVRVGSNGQLNLRTKTARRTRGFRAFLNGRAVASSFFRRGSRGRIANLDADHGLRYGRNTLVLEAFHKNGTYGRIVRRFRARRDRPLPGAGSGHSVDLGRAVRFSAGNSRRSRHRSRLSYRWSIYRAPRGSRAKLSGARTTRPRLVGDRRGTYGMRLTVRESGRRVVSSDQVEIDLLPLDPPVGVKIDTIPARGKGVTIDGAEVAPAPAAGVQAIVLKRATREVLKKASYDPTTASGMQGLQGLINDKNNDLTRLVILTGGARPMKLSSKQGKTLMGVIKQIGGTDRGLTAIGNRGLGQGQWSVIGSRGFPPGSATQNIRAYPGSSLGTLEGRLAAGSLGYTFVFPQYVDFDTGGILKSSGGALSRIEVGTRHFDSGTFISGVQAGFHVVVLDQDTLEPLKNVTIVTNDSREADLGRQGAQKGLDALRPILAGARSGKGPPALVLVNSVNSPYPDGGFGDGIDQTNHWFDLADVLTVDPSAGPLKSSSFGGTRDVFTSQPGVKGGQGGYALVGGTNLPGYTPAETSTAVNGKPGRVQGVLSRNRQGQWTAEHWNRDDSVDKTMFRLAYQDPTPWPASDTAQERAANSYLATQLGLPYTGDIRRNYWKHAEDFADGEQSILYTRLAVPGGRQYVACPDDRPDFSKADCEAVKNAVIDEIPKVGMVISGVNHLQDIFVQGQSNVTASASDVDSKIKKHFIPPPKAAGVDWLGFTGGLFLVGEAVGEDIPGVGAVFGLADAGLEIASAFSDSGDSDGDGPRLPVPDQIDATAANVGKRVNDTLDHAANNLFYLRNILVSDPVKLSTAAKKIHDGPWDFLDPNNRDVVARGINTSAAQQLWSAILPAGYPNLWHLRSAYSSVPGCGHKAPDTDYYRFITDYDGNGGWLVSTRIVGTGNSKNNPPSSVTGSLFKRVFPDGGVGLERPSFYQQNFRAKATC